MLNISKQTLYRKLEILANLIRIGALTIVLAFVFCTTRYAVYEVATVVSSSRVSSVAHASTLTPKTLTMDVLFTQNLSTSAQPLNGKRPGLVSFKLKVGHEYIYDDMYLPIALMLKFDTLKDTPIELQLIKKHLHAVTNLHLIYDNQHLKSYAPISQVGQQLNMFLIK